MKPSYTSPEDAWITFISGFQNAEPNYDAIKIWKDFDRSSRSGICLCKTLEGGGSTLCRAAENLIRVREPHKS